MSSSLLQQDLERTGRTLARWRAGWLAMLWAAALAVSLLAGGLADLLFRLNRPWRVGFWVAALALLAAAVRRIAATYGRRHSIEGVAAAVEAVFPELDNRLINYVQFSRGRSSDAFIRSYLGRGVPEWRSVDIRRMKDRRATRRAQAVLTAALLLAVLPVLPAGAAWPLALWRIINPFSNALPASLTTIVSVEPGDALAVQGRPIQLRCTVQGRAGHRVFLDLKPVAESPTTLELGRIAGSGAETFSHPIRNVAAPLRYRFRAGDAPSPGWFTVKTRPPLAFSQVTIKARPPAYTGRPELTMDAMAGELAAPAGTALDISAEANAPLHALTAGVDAQPPAALARLGGGPAWGGSMTLGEGTRLALRAQDEQGEFAELGVRLAVVGDLPPAVRVLSPRGPSTLAAGERPRIEFSAGDDYGLAELTLERDGSPGSGGPSGTVVHAWAPAGATNVTLQWTAPEPLSAAQSRVAFRVVALDACPTGVHTSRSPAIVFQAVSGGEAAAETGKAQAAAAGTLGRLIDLQRANRDATQQLQESAADAAAGEWVRVTDAQKRVRSLAAELLASPARVLGGLTPTMQKLYQEEMAEAITVLERVPGLQVGARSPVAGRAVAIEEQILRQLTFAGASAERTREIRQISGLLARLEALVKGQTEVLDGTKDCLKQGGEAGPDLAERQDGLAEDVDEFVAACRREAPSFATTDAAFSDLVRQIGDDCESREVRADMLRAAEALEGGQAAEAIPNEERALATLRELYDRMNAWRIASAGERFGEVVEAMQETSNKLEKLAKLQAGIVEAMRQVEHQKDRSDQAVDMMEEEIAEVKENMKDALLQVPRDLHIFPELTLANELVEDVYSVFEETQAQKGPQSEADIGERGAMKEQALLEMMKKAVDRADEMEMWMEEAADSVAALTESFDREEMPPMALGALPAALQDVIGDLIKAEEKLAKKADDSATNHGIPDFDPGWSIAEGETTSFGAQGKSGNQVPDHKEQTGRSNVGRQGQASGETAAGAGTINEGDGNIEKRMTSDPLQSGQVQADGEADENATGGGKQASGGADEYGMSGAGSNRRIDSTEPGSWKGLEALMAKTQAVYVKASLLNIRTESLAAAAHHMRQAEDAIAAGLPISAVREHNRRAMGALRSAMNELGTGVGESLDEIASATPLEDATETANENAPAAYRVLVTEYFKALNETL